MRRATFTYVSYATLRDATRRDDLYYDYRHYGLGADGCTAYEATTYVLQLYSCG